MRIPSSQTTRWLVRTGIALSAIVAYMVLKQQRKQSVPGTILTMPSRQSPLQEALASEEDMQDLITEMLGHQESETPIAEALAIAVAESTPEETQTASRADQQEQLIGNTRTKVYHSESDIHLPNEEHRIYFSSTHEAVDAGYRKAE